MDEIPKNMQHVSREELYTSLPARIHYLHSFLEFGPDDVNALVEGQKYIKAVIPAIVNIVYKKLLQYDITARVFSNRDSRDETNPERWVSEESTQIQHRKMFLRWYLTKLNSDPTKMEYWEYLDKVGLMHVGKGRRNPLHVDYMFLGACLAYIQDSFFEAILSHPRLDLSRKIALVKALGKVIWIQNDLMEKWQSVNGLEFREDEDDSEMIPQASEAEGYLNGKKILGAGSSSSSGGGGGSIADDASSVAGSVAASSVHSNSSGKTSLGRPLEDATHLSGPRCPFSGMSIADRDEQRATATRSPRLEKEPDVMRQFHKPGTPRVRLVDGKTVMKENLDATPFEN
ncbi:hypothetical protein AAFC00_004002 [Neodothiora populina]|uniref:Globin-sensor domain-containing protein n=1 Tax=Neodothiora populina TaxID=2781224 RepID=A0ABR3PJC1_9PEZI